ncbi:MAG: hypothetical protein ACLUB2_01890 [Butyricicoccus pullicaecorum]
MANKKRNRILELDPEHFREVDGVVFDLDSFARHCAPHPAPHKPTQTTQAAEPQVQTAQPSDGFSETGAMPAPVFFCDPVHIGWYPIQIEGPSYPVKLDAASAGSADEHGDVLRRRFGPARIFLWGLI